MKRSIKKSGDSKRQWFAVIALVLIGTMLGTYVLVRKNTPAADDDGHGHGTHAEAKSHSDGEHHDKKADDKHDHDKGHGDAEHHDKKPNKGAHGGQLFTDGKFTLEALLTEQPGGAKLQVWLAENGTALPPASAKLSATVTRPNGDKQELTFDAGKDSAVSREVVVEPHAFDISIAAQTATEPFLFVYTKEEGKVELTDAQIQAAAITTDAASAARIKTILQLPGEIKLNEDRTAHVVPRLAGVVDSVRVSVGQTVRKGEVLAVIASVGASEQRSELQTAQRRLALAKVTYEREKSLWEQRISAQQDFLQAGQQMHEAEVAVANAQQKLGALGLGSGAGGSLNRLELRAPFDGIVIEKHLSLGEAVKEDAAVLTISDLSQVWAEINVPAKDLPAVRVGERVNIRATAFEADASGKVAYVGALIGEQTRGAKARVVLANPKGAWRPGLFVNVEVLSEERDSPVTVSPEAIQSVGDKPVVFLKIPGGFLAQPVTVGRSDGKRVEITEGLRPGARYAASGSFVLKSEMGKSSVEHAH